MPKMTQGQMNSARSFHDLHDAGLDISARMLLVHTIRIYGAMCLVDAVQTMVDHGYRGNAGTKNFQARVDEARRFGGYLRKTGHVVLSRVTGKGADEWAYVPPNPPINRLRAMLQERDERLQRQLRERDEAQGKVNDVQTEVNEMHRLIRQAQPVPRPA